MAKIMLKLHFMSTKINCRGLIQMDEIKNLTTEKRNPKTMELDEMTVHRVLEVMNEEDQKVSQSIAKALNQIEAVIDLIVDSFQNNGRLIYIGAGTSGRLGVLDASECVPTFGTDPSMVQGLIAGGKRAMTMAVEGAEDSEILAQKDVEKLNLQPSDIVVGLAASGRTPYVIAGLKKARQLGAKTASLACNLDAEISKFADKSIEVDVGPEILSGSTRLKAGTAEKLILNMLSTISMVKIGKTYGNLMVDVKSTNEKLKARARNMIALATGIGDEEAGKYFELAGHNSKVAIVMCLGGYSAEEARKRLKDANGFVRSAIKKS